MTDLSRVQLIGLLPCPSCSIAKDPEPVTASVAEDHERVEVGPRYLQLVRKEARLRPDQVAALSVLRRRLTVGRVSREEILTDNTLVRVAVDLLLAHADRLSGNTEVELRRSMTA